MRPSHALQALVAICARELLRFVQQRTRLVAALVRPTLWLAVFGTGLRGWVEVPALPPYDAPVAYPTYLVPGLLGMVLLFGGMQSSLALVYDRELGTMRLLLTAPLPRAWLLACKLAAGSLLSVLQALVFLGICALVGVPLPPWGALAVLPALLLAAAMLGAFGLLLSATVRQLENFAGTMNFVIFPMFFLSPALYPLRSEGWLPHLARINPFSHAVELLRHALHGRLQATALAVVAGCLLVFFVLAVYAYDPQRGLMRRTGAAAA